MKADFLDAHQRHWHDAEHLFQSQRWANADHLYGMAAECGLKSLMSVFGMIVDSGTGSPTNKKDWKHANEVWARFETYRSGHPQGAGFALSPRNPFSLWEVADRYANQSNFNQARVQGHQAGAQEVGTLIAQAQRNGLLPP